MKAILCFFLFTILPCSFALERIWIIRHCDKPSNKNNPCCSEIGYKRANAWYQYFQTYLKKDDKIKIITSNYDFKKSCIPQGLPLINTATPNSQCQKSQRMWITGYYIFSNLRVNMKFQLHNQINSEYCVGQYKEMLHHIMNKDTETTDAIIVWEHNEIIDIIRHLGIKIDPWKNDNIYDIVFMIQLHNKTSTSHARFLKHFQPKNKLYYDCYSIEKDGDTCEKTASTWLKKTKKISNKEENQDNPTFFEYNTQHQIHWIVKLIVAIVVSTILIYLSIVVCCCKPATIVGLPKPPPYPDYYQTNEFIPMPLSS